MLDPPSAALSSVDDQTRAQDVKQAAQSPGEPHSPRFYQDSSCWKASSNAPSSGEPFLKLPRWAERALSVAEHPTKAVLWHNT